jgi:hypothetical protein
MAHCAPITDEEVEIEIDRLRKSKHVKLAQKEARLKQRRRQYMYGLRVLEKRGKQLEAEGFTMDSLDHEIEQYAEEEST